MKNIYKLICIIYNFIFSAFENFFLVNKSLLDINSKINSQGFELIKSNKKVNIETKLNLFKQNPYMEKNILKKQEIYEYTKFLFEENNLKNIITNKTGYKYSIDYVISYITYNLPDNIYEQEIYANRWHNDKPFTKNTLKIILPLNETGEYKGGIEILNINQSNNFKLNNSLLKDEKFFIFDNKLNNILIFKPNICFHRAGNPNITKGRKQIMFQLNPSKNWCINDSIHKRQLKIEPKFPFFSYLFDKKINLEAYLK